MNTWLYSCISVFTYKQRIVIISGYKPHHAILLKSSIHMGLMTLKDESREVAGSKRRRTVQCAGWKS